MLAWRQRGRDAIEEFEGDLGTPKEQDFIGIPILDDVSGRHDILCTLEGNASSGSNLLPTTRKKREGKPGCRLRQGIYRMFVYRISRLVDVSINS